MLSSKTIFVHVFSQNFQLFPSAKMKEASSKITNCVYCFCVLFRHQQETKLVTNIMCFCDNNGIQFVTKWHGMEVERFVTGWISICCCPTSLIFRFFGIWKWGDTTWRQSRIHNKWKMGGVYCWTFPATEIAQTRPIRSEWFFRTFHTAF